MTIRRAACFIVSCDDCRKEFDETADYVVHFDTEDDAVNYLAETGWVISESGIVNCPPCSAIQLCDRLGHLWSPWAPCRCKGLLPGHAEHGCGLVCHCDQCGVSDAITLANLPTIDEPTTFGR
ncbi:hypothetical protein [Pseudonocardia sp. GCM10023141]|uniref:hypothetical protein n=1 Tax=Pseudonocardia sp. GCM10023141 TaxID=3252653 RepID=UPI00361071D2